MDKATITLPEGLRIRAHAAGINVSGVTAAALLRSVQALEKETGGSRQATQRRREMTFCPKCDYPQYCGCGPTCLSKIPVGIKPYRWTPDGEARICHNCGFTQSDDGWLMIYEQQVKEGRVE